MTRRPLIAAAALSAAVLTIGAAGPAHAFTRSGGTTISFDGKDLRHDFRTVFDAGTGDFVRTGTISLPRGDTVTYEITGSCKAGTGCFWTGTGNGPFSMTWSGEGTVRRHSDSRITAEGSLTGPRGNVVTFSRDVDGDVLPDGLNEILR